MSNIKKLNRVKLELHQAMEKAQERYEYKSAHAFKDVLEILEGIELNETNEI